MDDYIKEHKDEIIAELKKEPDVKPPPGPDKWEDLNAHFESQAYQDYLTKWLERPMHPVLAELFARWFQDILELDHVHHVQIDEETVIHISGPNSQVLKPLKFTVPTETKPLGDFATVWIKKEKTFTKRYGGGMGDKPVNIFVGVTTT